METVIANGDISMFANTMSHPICVQSPALLVETKVHELQLNCNTQNPRVEALQREQPTSLENGTDTGL